MASWFKGKRKDGFRTEAGSDDSYGSNDSYDMAGEGAVTGGGIEDVLRPVGEPTVELRPVAAAEPAPEVAPADGFDEFDADGMAGAAEVYEQTVADRRALVALCLYAHDRARSSGVAERIEEGLAGVGVTALRPEGERFDPAVHEAGGTVGTEDESLDGMVAETEVVGFSDRGHLLRAPIVTVYTSRATTA
ncbi:nucleotide exchange factor GrpE [Actinokineospora enzanensis]|uniref:nucleotide exchange factor GrpE n=1 Tax=Actinokineospora enzanensis TaxID=155975 RepID=UPI0003A5DEE5|nr:nucleotide exchange factor GrpE [Actinokineospora enzanensis]